MKAKQRSNDLNHHEHRHHRHRQQQQQHPSSFSHHHGGRMLPPAVFWQCLLLLLVILLLIPSSRPSNRGPSVLQVHAAHAAHPSDITTASSVSPHHAHRFESWTNNHANTRPMQTNPSPTSTTRLSVSVQTSSEGSSIQALASELLSNNSYSYDMIVIGVPENSTITTTTTSSNDTTPISISLDSLDSLMVPELDADAGSRSAAVLLPASPHPPDHNNHHHGQPSTESSERGPTTRRVVLIRMGSSDNMDHARKVGASLATLMMMMMSAQPSAATATARSTSSRNTKKKKKKKDTPPSFAVLLPFESFPSSNKNNTTATVMDDWMTHFTTSFLLGFYKDKRFQKKHLAKEKSQQQRQQVQLQRTVDLFVHMTTTATNSSTTQEESSSTSNGGDNSTASGTVQSRLENAVRRGGILANGVAFARDVVNAPHNVLNSYSLAATAMQLARRYSSTMTCRILNARDCERLGMGAFLGVARASETEAQFIHLTYKSRPASPFSFWAPQRRRLGIVGKGLLFDTGGYSIKTSTGMLGMKMDCGGAGAVLGAAQTLAELEPKSVEVHFLIAACENMINEKGMVPGDILTASNGKTIEVINTDAEGRLTMADALVYADLTLGCQSILELSTLTGACMMALGSAMAGYWTNSDDFSAALEDASRASGEKVWRMPMATADYGSEIKSKLADLRNMGTGRMGGAIHAALFLQHFVRPHVPFCHVDIAGPAMNTKSSEATGYGSLLITEWVVQHQHQ